MNQMSVPRLNILAPRCALFAALLTLMAANAIAADPVTQPTSAAELRRGFEKPPDSARMMVRWWWFGPSVTKPELEREMRLMKQGGIGGFEVQPTYAPELDNPATGLHNFPYMSQEFLAHVREIVKA